MQFPFFQILQSQSLDKFKVTHFQKAAESVNVFSPSFIIFTSRPALCIIIIIYIYNRRKSYEDLDLIKIKYTTLANTFFIYILNFIYYLQ